MDITEEQYTNELVGLKNGGMPASNKKNSRPTEKGVALVNKKNIQNGIFYQDLLAAFGDNSSKLETGYISYGLFEDLFLNSLIAENSKTDIHNVRFNTKETLVRYSPLLVRKQQALPNNSEGLSQFVYPTDTDWLSEGYHCRTAYTEVPEDFDGTLKDYRKSLYEKMLLFDKISSYLLKIKYILILN